jgi:beta-lactamase regulating signal transducer with metallopeptidase domain
MSVVVALALMHFIWQGALIGAVAWVAMRLSHTPTTRYAIGVVALMAMAIAPVVGGMNQVRGSRFEVPSPSSSQVLGTSSVPGPASSSLVQPNVIVAPPADVVAATSSAAGRWKWNVDPTVLSTVFSLWLFGVALLSTRLTVGWWAARRLTRRSVRQPSLQVLSNAERLMAALGITGGVRVLESALVQVPTAMGWLKPVVLLPASAMTGLSIAQIDALVAHELAHIKRHDYLVNLLQSAIETLLFYHPAVWLISRRVREERELCCDDPPLRPATTIA